MDRDRFLDLFLELLEQGKLQVLAFDVEGLLLRVLR